MQVVVESMGRAKWITGTATVAPGYVILSFTRHGVAQMRKARKAFHEIAPQCCMPPKKWVDGKPVVEPPSLEQATRLHHTLNAILKELPGPFPPGSSEVLTDLFSVYGILEEDLLAKSAKDVKFEMACLKGEE